jgi:DNA repair exonuclease SbcCD ATPase subunit
MKPGTGKSWLLRSSLVVIILSFVATGVLNLSRVKQKIERLQTNLAAQTVAREKAELELASTKKDLTATTARLKETSASLAEAVDREQKALAAAAGQTRRADALNKELAQLRQQHEETSARLARFEGAGMEPEQVLFVGKRLKSLEAELAGAKERTRNLELQLTKALKDRPESEPVILPAGLKAKVIAADPRWHFVVLNAGEKEGVLERGEVLLSREGKLVAKAKVSRVHTDQCIANLMPGWELREIVEGDEAIPAPPHS